MRACTCSGANSTQLSRQEFCIVVYIHADAYLGQETHGLDVVFVSLQVSRHSSSAL